MNFNIDHREVEECRDAYVELQSRIQALREQRIEEEVSLLVRRMGQSRSARVLCRGVFAVAFLFAGWGVAIGCAAK